MDKYIDAQAFKDCYITFQKADSDRDVLFKQLLDGYDTLLRENSTIKQQIEDEKETRIMWQNYARSYQKELVQSKLATESHPFVVMIVDGDGAKFRDEYFRLGDLGGGQAAHELKDRIMLYLHAKYPSANIESWNIIVQFYANMGGLGKILAARQILPTSLDLQKFASGFGRANNLFSFVDVGYGKDKADHKCCEMLKIMLHISSCRQVLFGPCRDNGYLTLLEEYRHDPIIKKKLTLFSAEPAEPGFIDLGLETVNFPSVFRCEPLNMFSRPIAASSHIKATYNSGLLPSLSAFSPTPRSASYLADGSSDLMEDSSQAFTAPSPDSSAGNVSFSSPTSQTTWACVSKLSNAPIIDLYPKKLLPKLKYMLQNAANQRVDERLPSAETAAFRSIDDKSRLYSRNFCNNYHLTGRCGKGDTCDYQHDVAPKLTLAEKLALRHKSRQLPCQSSRWCDDVSCVSGHHCKNIYSGQNCSFGPTCFFKDTHDADIRPTLKIYEDGSRENLTPQGITSGI